ncbi:hypothetical protein M5K25_028105 [Dendrobium thyrsiflorum]|uniref:Uncharacterized protein n=1 Tax=Dendrobium thyrsiflorum TaxID=117978 RepID=A0ABD0TVN7_DENTH
MSLNQGLKALLEGSNRNSDYQTVSKFDNLIVESSGSTRQVQRAQERRNPTSLSQKIVHQTIHDQGIQYRPSVPNHSLFPRIYGPCHSRKSINRVPFLLEKGGQGQSKSLKRLRERSKTALAPCSSSTTAGVPPDHRLKALHSAGPPPKRPYISPDHHLKALHSAGPPPKGPIVRRTTSRRPYTSPDHRRATSQRPYTSPDHRRVTSQRPYTSSDHRRATNQRPYTSPDHQSKALHFAGPPPGHQSKALRLA